MIAKETVFAKALELNTYVDRLSALVNRALQEHIPVHEVEEQALRIVLGLAWFGGCHVANAVRSSRTR